jgi:hypothetical protein
MKSVWRFEANLLRVLQSFLGRAPSQQAATLVMRQPSAPSCLSRAAIELLQDHLSKGVVRYLAQSGWKPERFLRGGRVVAGRLWQRTAPENLGLTFSRQSAEFLLWIMTAAAKETKSWKPKQEELTVGDRFLFFLAMQCLRGSDPGKVLARQDVFQRDALIRLAFPDQVSDTRARITWGPWTTGIGACMLEGLQDVLSARWIEIERGKARETNAGKLLALGTSQAAVLCNFTDALTATGRRDLARFLLSALANVLRDTPPATRWLGQCNFDSMRLAARSEIWRAALALVRHTSIFQEWDAQARTVGYFDEGYAAAQLWKSDWESHEGEHLHRVAQALLREIEPLQ